MDEKLRMSLWVELEALFREMDRDAGSSFNAGEKYRGLWEFVWEDFFIEPVSDLVGVNSYHIFYSRIKEKYFKLEWHKVYDFIEFIANRLSTQKWLKDGFEKSCNSKLERQNSGYRFVNGCITPITNKLEINCVEDAVIGVGDETKKHINEAVRFLKERSYRECMNNAILGLEAYFREVSGLTGKTLSNICNSNKIPLHILQINSIEKLYSYTSDTGVRHASKPGEEFNYEDGKNMLIQCTSWINLIKSKLPNNS